MTEKPKAATPSIAVPDAGTTTIDDKLTFEPQRLSYQSAAAIAHRIAKEVASHIQGKNVIIAETALLADFANLSAVYVSLDVLQREYDNIASQAGSLGVPKLADFELPAPSAEFLRRPEGAVLNAGAALYTGAALAAAAGSPVLGAALGLIGLLKQDVQYHGAETPIDSLSFEIALAAHVKKAGAAAAIVPDLTVVTAATHGAGSLNARVKRLQDAKSAAWSKVGPLISSLVHLERQLDELTASATQKNPKDAADQKQIDALAAKVADARRDLEPLSLPLERADQKFADLQAQWSQPDAQTGISLLARLLRAEAIKAKGGTYLHAAVVSSGGHHRISHNLLRMIMLGDGLSFAGGAIARWALLNEHGEVQRGGILNARETSGLLFKRDNQPVFD